MIELSENNIDLTPKVATIGFFDGVHLGHDFLLQQLNFYAVRNNLESMVVTFSNHPRLFFQPDCGLKQLTLSDEKINIIKRKEIKYTLMLNFSDDLSKLTSFEFMQMLSKRYGVKALLIGYDHHFGSDKNTTFQQYIEYGKLNNIKILQCVEHVEHDLVVSSSKIRRALNSSDIILANELLGHNYAVTGKVVSGKQIGRKIGYPTANLQMDPLKLLPADGVYSVKVYLSVNDIHWGILNIGNRPTVNGKEKTVEVFIIDFTGDLYGKTLTLEFIDFIRNEQKFNDLESLKHQIQDDIKAVKMINKI